MEPHVIFINVGNEKVLFVQADLSLGDHGTRMVFETRHQAESVASKLRENSVGCSYNVFPDNYLRKAS